MMDVTINISDKMEHLASMRQFFAEAVRATSPRPAALETLAAIENGSVSSPNASAFWAFEIYMHEKEWCANELKHAVRDYVGCVLFIACHGWENSLGQ